MENRTACTSIYDTSPVRPNAQLPLDARLQAPVDLHRLDDKLLASLLVRRPVDAAPRAAAQEFKWGQILKDGPERPMMPGMAHIALGFRRVHDAEVGQRLTHTRRSRVRGLPDHD